MTVKIETIELDHFFQKVAKTMKNEKISSLVVVDNDGRAFGIVTERDSDKKKWTFRILAVSSFS